MNLIKFARISILLAFIVAMLSITPTNIALANIKSNQMISEDCLQNPETCEDSQPAADAEKSAAIGFGLWDYMKMFFSLVLVLALLILILKFINKRSTSYQQNSVVRNIGGISVGPQKSVQLLHIGDTLYIVGVGEDVQLIKEIKHPDEVKQLLEYYNEKQTFVTSTTPYIVDLFNKIKWNTNTTKIEDNDSNFGDLLNKKITDIKAERKSELEKWKEKERDK
ncbi:flagellar biosynthetic protein FliO [Lysinibacillus antri]|uniref:Flagellar protein n=1 Tax=Lysinibacillus antri TaxID=2498145 RepID=A0A432LEX5_9BACI|nr:flagellar biosynthetic protein FliO [Lysinibacillus antri]RUL55794.1 hypothetical protein EK386_02985 [Lysinibacillus antri]